MKYRYAKALHNGDEVTVKKSGRVCKIIQVNNAGNAMFFWLDDGKWYHHREIA